MVRIDIETATSGSSILSKIARELGLEQQYAKVSGQDVNLLTLRMYQRGCCGLFADEMQFASRSATANALTARVLTQLSELRVPLIYLGNYSLGHRLWNRPPEDTDRFLSAPLIMLAEPPESPDFARFVTDFQTLMPAADLDIQLERDGPELHSLSFGLRRMIGRLFASSYAAAVEDLRGKRGVVKIDMDRMRAIYNTSTDYQRDRLTVENLFAAILGVGGFGIAGKKLLN